MPVDLGLIIFIVFILEGFAATVFSVVIVLKLEDHKEQALTSFQLHPDSSETEFKTLYWAYTGGLIGTALGLAASFLEVEIMGTAGGVIAAVSYIPTVFVYYWWARRM